MAAPSCVPDALGFVGVLVFVRLGLAIIVPTAIFLAVVWPRRRRIKRISVKVYGVGFDTDLDS
jgi:hypothetical protein